MSQNLLLNLQMILYIVRLLPANLHSKSTRLKLQLHPFIIYLLFKQSLSEKAITSGVSILQIQKTNLLIICIMILQQTYQNLQFTFQYLSNLLQLIQKLLKMKFSQLIALIILLTFISQIYCSSYQLDFTCKSCPGGTICPAGTSGSNCIYANGGDFNNQLMECSFNCTGYPQTFTVSQCDTCPSPSCCMTYMGISICVPTGPSADRICKFNGTPIWLIILIVVVCLAVVGGIGFIVYKKVILPRKNNQGYVKQGSEPALQ